MKPQRRSVLHKLGARNMAQATAMTMREGAAPPDDDAPALST